MKKILYPITFFILLVITPFANAYHPQQQTNQNDPIKYIQTALDKLEEFSSNTNTASPILLRTFIENEIIPHFSFDEMSRWITGPFAQRMTKEEKADFQEKTYSEVGIERAVYKMIYLTYPIKYLKSRKAYLLNRI